MDRKFFNGLAVGCVATLVITLGVVTLTQNSNVLDSKSLTKLNQITSIIENEYYGEYSDSDIIEGIFEGALFNLDSHSYFMSQDDYEDDIDADQQFGGIGVSASYNKFTKVYKLTYCYEGSPAFIAGLKRNDIVVAVDDYDTYGMELEEISKLIRGEPGSTVKLTVSRDDEILEFDVVRKLVDIPYAYSQVLSQAVGYVKISSFNGTVVTDFEKALAELGDVKGLIIDLRGNGGGTIGVYRDIMSQLIPSCTLHTIVRKDGTRTPLYMESELSEPRYEFVILCDSTTASCAEAMTQALRDLTGAMVVGEETYGKGVAQEYFEIDDKSVVRLTIGYIESPNGVVWDVDGITPDIEMEYAYIGNDSSESVLIYDNQVMAAYELLAAKVDEDFLP